jgi:hypothetical protein
MYSPGWFAVPEHPGMLRYFDGTHWTDQYAQQGQSLPTPVGPQRMPFFGFAEDLVAVIKAVAWAVAGLVVLGVMTLMSESQR